MSSQARLKKKFSQNYRYGFADPERALFRSPKGATHDVVDIISGQKKEPAWVRERRHQGLDFFLGRPVPAWGADLSEIDFDDIYYYIRPVERTMMSWKQLPSTIKQTFNRLRIPQYEREFLAGVGAQYDSENVYHHIADKIKETGVIFTDVETACKKYPSLVKKYFGTVISANDNKFAALNTAMWSGGSFIYVPKGVRVDLPLQAYFRINAKNMGQFERTLIIADEGSFVHYVEGCSAPVYVASSLHGAVVEIVALKNSRVRYTTVQNWSKNVYNLVTKRAHAHENAIVEWVDFNFGAKVTMKYPAVFLLGEGARADILSMAFAGARQHQDAGAKVTHVAPNTSSRIISKSISAYGGRTSYRGLVYVGPKALNSRVSVRCDALILDKKSRSDTYPTMKIMTNDANIEHEATVSRIGEDQLFYLQSRGLSREQAEVLLVNGFIEPLVKELPMEYAVEMNRLIELEMEGSVG
ncbi:MAG: Fe-S cluster assembly protein SufB [Candidatus Komeilibacteria bacterium RIFCSPLOWO2_01_FULL_52_15]|uniref:Fe-S cluster assembly protein SufB n=2 Tax=Candidatus Komeiliibacteriota TaxID=1817908 RepID=A0A1G2BS79_9BACT|nr:MAG: Fe-S cluster assembly protein SufB [Candidatus Komeilibacteria bacterium RIFCSPHIGHO2_01_FULL_52_14]OGY91902.1 MAG: Fe-S cluster assembly protein SufB [Candidatus Komeilibacteria bacterium RIFCSPLOWO2_01_FULL_52_15]